MKPFIVLIAAFIISALTIRLVKGTFNIDFAATIAMSVMLLFTAMGHFMFTRGMTLMIPQFIPFKKELVYFTGIIEIAGAVGLLIPRLRTITGWLLIVFFILILPVNIKAAADHLDYQKATYDAKGLVYLWFRVPLQILFMVWTWFSSIMK